HAIKAAAIMGAVSRHGSADMDDRAQPARLQRIVGQGHRQDWRLCRGALHEQPGAGAEPTETPILRDCAFRSKIHYATSIEQIRKARQLRVYGGPESGGKRGTGRAMQASQPPYPMHGRVGGSAQGGITGAQLLTPAPVQAMHAVI